MIILALLTNLTNMTNIELTLTPLQREFFRSLKLNSGKKKLAVELSEIIEDMEIKPSSSYSIIESLKKKGLIEAETKYEAGRVGQVTKVKPV